MQLAHLPRRAGHRQAAALPEIVVVDLGDRRRRTGSGAAPSPRGHACACPSASPPPGSGARPRGCRRSRQLTPVAASARRRARCEPPALRRRLAETLRERGGSACPGSSRHCQLPFPTVPGWFIRASAAEPEHVLHRQDRDPRAGRERSRTIAHSRSSSSIPAASRSCVRQREILGGGGREPLGDRRVVVRARVDDGVLRVGGDRVPVPVALDEAAADDPHPEQAELLAERGRPPA